MIRRGRIFSLIMIIFFVFNFAGLFSYDVNPNATRIIGRWFNMANDGGMVMFIFREDTTFQFMRFTNRAKKIWDFKGEFIVLGQTLNFSFNDGTSDSWTILKFDRYDDSGIERKRMLVVDKKGKKIFLFEVKDNEQEEYR